MPVNEKMPNAATISVIIKTKDVVKQMIQGVAAYQYEPDCFQNITYKHFLTQMEAIAKISMLSVTSFSLPED